MLIDLQRDYLDAPEIEPSVGSILDRALLLLQQCRERGIPILHVWTTVNRNPDNRMPHWRRLNRWICESGTPGHAPPAAFAPRQGELSVAKRGYSAFAETDVLKLLNGRQIDTVLLAGVHLHACIRQTAIDAYQAGFDVWIAADAVGSNDPIHAAITRRYLEARSMEFVPAEFMLQRLESTAAAHNAASSGAFDAAITTADEFAVSWKNTERSDRRRMVVELRRQMTACQEEWADLITSDIGKPLQYSRAEVRRTLQMIDAIAQRELVALDVEATSSCVLRRRPHGIVGVVTPYNNPLYIPLGKIVPAVLHGNTVVWKPAPKAQRTSAQLLEVMRRANWPPGLATLVEGDHRAGQSVLADHRIKAATITGSLAAGCSAQEICARRRIPLQAELGGNNAAVVWPDADVELAAREVAAGAFVMAGQRCTANRRVIVHQDCRDRFLEFLVEATKALSWGDPRLDATHIGPLVSSEHCRRVSLAVDRATCECGSPLYVHDQGCLMDDEYVGAWYPPTIIACNAPELEIVQEETFGPILVVQTALDWEHAIRLCNGVRQGLVAAVFTRSRGLVDAFLAEAEAGILKVNHSTADADVDAPFGGWKASGIGPPEHGDFDLDFYTRPQTVYGFTATRG